MSLSSVRVLHCGCCAPAFAFVRQTRAFRPIFPACVRVKFPVLLGWREDAPSLKGKVVGGINLMNTPGLPPLLNAACQTTGFLKITLAAHHGQRMECGR